MGPDILDPDDHRLIHALSASLRPALNRYFLRRRMSPLDAEDAVQEVFARLSKRPGLSKLHNVEGYLFEAAASVAVDHHRRAASRQADAHDHYDDALHATYHYGPDRDVEGRQQLSIALKALLKLPEKTRTVVILSRLEQLRHAEIARRLGISTSAVEKHLAKALLHISRHVEERV
ncbi:RNA polymerase sigma factor [Aquamicrobium terrae]|uniref:RNA polymerase sigma-70 factor (ECF subfamily) n=1 Tax=Aquamicrobium terrae TaxID=1324945 RepID=A0ABV2N6D5_9HYPH